MRKRHPKMKEEEAEAKGLNSAPNIPDPKWSGCLQRACKAPKGTKSRLSWMNHSLSLLLTRSLSFVF